MPSTMASILRRLIMRPVLMPATTSLCAKVDQRNDRIETSAPMTSKKLRTLSAVMPVAPAVFGRQLPVIYAFLSGADRHGLQHRGKDAEPTFQKISSQAGGKLCEVRPHRHAEIWRGRTQRAQLSDPGF